ncbi:MAG: toll/interleukin-1 receptor domain-containing protein [Neomegalonema sp.]|nr:toll/interleukin-1 receptor domain-containing protein [Neomegalonema sp.]
MNANTEERPFVFVSYSRKDAISKDSISKILEGENIAYFIDSIGIEPGEDWQGRLLSEIIRSDKFVALISNNYISSEICLWEIGTAIKLSKQIIPIRIDDFEVENIPQNIAALNIIDGMSDELLSANKEKVSSAIRSDYRWERGKADISELAHNWRRKGRKISDLILSRDRVKTIDDWRRNRPRGCSDIGSIEIEYIESSRNHLSRMKRRQRLFLLTSSAATLSLALLSLFYFYQFQGEKVSTRVAMDESSRKRSSKLSIEGSDEYGSKNSLTLALAAITTEDGKTLKNRSRVTEDFFRLTSGQMFLHPISAPGNVIFIGSDDTVIFFNQGKIKSGIIDNRKIVKQETLFDLSSEIDPAKYKEGGEVIRSIMLTPNSGGVLFNVRSYVLRAGSKLKNRTIYIDTSKRKMIVIDGQLSLSRSAVYKGESVISFNGTSKELEFYDLTSGKLERTWSLTSELDITDDRVYFSPNGKRAIFYGYSEEESVFLIDFEYMSWTEAPRRSKGHTFNIDSDGNIINIFENAALERPYYYEFFLSNDIREEVDLEKIPLGHALENSSFKKKFKNWHIALHSGGHLSVLEEGTLRIISGASLLAYGTVDLPDFIAPGLSYSDRGIYIYSNKNKYKNNIFFYDINEHMDFLGLAPDKQVQEIYRWLSGDDTIENICEHSDLKDSWLCTNTGS